MSRVMATYPLRYPIVRETRDQAGEEHEEVLRHAGFMVEVRRPRAKDLKVMDQFEGQEISGSIALLGRVTNLSAEEVDLLDADDMGELGNLLSAGAPSGPPTGKTA